MAINGLSASVGEGVENGAALLRAPLFRDIAARLGEGGRWVVLDLGRPHGATIEYFGRYRSRLVIADIYTGVEALNALEDGPTAAALIQALLPPCGPDPVDLVLCWDVLNYLNAPAISALMDSLSVILRRGAALHALMSYSATPSPVTAGSYAIDPDGNLSGVPAADAQRPIGYTTAQLQRMMRGYTVVRSMLLRQGVQEYVFRYAPPPPGLVEA